MKILAVAGYGMSARILERHSQQFRKSLPPDWEYVFIEGEIACERSAALPPNIPGPFTCWYKIPYGEALAAAHELVHQVIETEGPFDGVMAFSQGAGVILSMLMHHELNQPHAQPPFNFAIFISCPVPFSPDPNFLKQHYAKHAASYMDHQDDDADSEATETSTSPSSSSNASSVTANAATHSSSSTSSSSSSSGPKYRASLLLAEKRRELAREISSILKEIQRLAVDISGEGDAFPQIAGKFNTAAEAIEAVESWPRVYHPLMFTERVSIPIVHIVGANDSWKKQTGIAMRLGSSMLTTQVTHKNGHTFPVLPADIRACVKAIDWAIDKSKHRLQFY